MLRVLLDEDISPRVAEGLRLRGIDTLSIHETDRTARTDDEQLTFAVSEHRVLITYNRRDFQSLDTSWRLLGKRHNGIIWCAERIILRRDIGALVRAIEALAREYAELDDLCLPLARSGEDGPADR